MTTVPYNVTASASEGLLAVGPLTTAEGYAGSYMIMGTMAAVSMDKKDTSFTINLSYDSLAKDGVGPILHIFFTVPRDVTCFGKIGERDESVMKEKKLGKGGRGVCTGCWVKHDSAICPRFFDGKIVQKANCITKVLNDIMFCTIHILEKQLNPTGYATWYLEVGSDPRTSTSTASQYERYVTRLACWAIVPDHVATFDYETYPLWEFTS